MKKVAVFLAGMAISLVLAHQVKAQTLQSVNSERSGSTSSNTFVNVGSSTGTLDVTHVHKVLTIGTFTSKTNSGNSIGGYRIADASNNSVNSGEFQHSHSGKDGVGSIVHIFDVSAQTGNRNYVFQHRTDANTLETSATLTAITLHDGSYHLNSAISQLTEVLVMTQSDSWQSVVTSSDVDLPANGGFYVAASLQNQRTSGGNSNLTTAEWVLQYKKQSEAEWKNISYPLERNPLQQQIGFASLVGVLPESTVAGTYQFRVAYKKSGPHNFEVQQCNLVVVALANTGGFFPVFISSNPQAYTTSGTLSPVIENIITSQTTTPLFMQAQYAVQPNGTTESARHDVLVKRGTTTHYDGMDFRKFLANASHKCSGSVSGITDLLEDQPYNVELRHASASGRNLTTTNAYLVGFALHRSSQSLVLPVTVNASQGVSVSSYATLGAAVSAINDGVFRGDVTIRINDSTTEVTTIQFNASGTGNTQYNSIQIYPTAEGIKIEGAEPLLVLNGTENITIDGRVNMEGATPSLTFSSSGTTLRLQNSAAGNTVRYSIIKGSSTSTTSGVIHFFTSASGNGNSNNILEYCHFTHAGSTRPGSFIYSNGTTSRINRDNIIRYNNFYDFLSPERHSSAIRIVRGTDFWNITDNSFYETQLMAPQSAFDYYVINIDISNANNFVISDNYLGGSAPQAKGAPFAFTTAVGSQFKGIYLRTSDVDLTSISGNTFSNFDFTSTHPNPWDAIYSYSGRLNIANNVIGSIDAEGSVKVRTPKAYITAQVSGGAVTELTIIGGGEHIPVAPQLSFSGGGGAGATATATVSGGVITGTTITHGGSGYTSAPVVRIENTYTHFSTVHGIRLFTQADVTIVNNTIASFDLDGSDYYALGFEGIYKDVGRGGNLLVEGNTIGKADTPDNIIIRSTAVNAVTAQRMYGIFFQGATEVQIRDNVVAGLTNNYSGTDNSTATVGIYATRGEILIEGNRVTHVKTFAGNGGGAQNASVFGIGIQNTSAGISHTIRGNEVGHISNGNTTSRVDLYGIYISGANNTFHEVSGNYVHNLNLSTSNTESYIDGVVLFGGKINFFNNIVHLGQGHSGGHHLVGVWDHAAWNCDLNFYFNTIWVEGTATGETQASYALWNRTQSNTPRVYKNNLFVNTRTGGTGGKHYTARIATQQNLTINYNTYATDGAFLAQFTNTDRTSLTDWKTSTGQDAGSYAENPAFSGLGAGFQKYYPMVPQQGEAVTGITVDYSGQLRSESNPKLGALEVYEAIWEGNISNDFANAANWAGAVVPGPGSVIRFATTPSRDLHLDQNRNIGGIVNASDKKLNINGFTLAITGTFYMEQPGEITANIGNSTLKLHGKTAWQLTANLFTGGVVNGLIIDNTGGVTLMGNLTIENSLELDSGVFSIGENELTLNGRLVLSGGTLQGGNGSTLVTGGTGEALNLPALGLKSLTLNRTNGAELIGNLSLKEELILTEGTLSVGAYTLNFSGIELSGDGSVDVSNEDGLLVIQHSAEITLPENFFANGTVSNLTIQGDTLLAGNSFTVTGILNLAGVNPAPDMGALHMGDVHVLTMGPDAITVGTGDVTGRIRRSSIAANTNYTFGSEHTYINFSGGTGAELPLELMFIVEIGKTHSVKDNTMNRYYQIIRTGGSLPTRFNLTLRYLDSELNGNTEEDLVFWDHHVPYNGTTSPHEHGKSSQNTLLNTITLASHGITYLVQEEYLGEIVYIDDTTTPPNQSKIWLISAKESISDYEWLGATNTSWDEVSNWSGGSVPVETSEVIIRGNVPYNPELTGSIEIKSLTILPGAQVNGSNAVLTVNSAININNGNVPWNNQGIYHPGNSTVVFTNANAAISGNTHFHHLQVANSAQIKLIEGTSIAISGDLTLEGTGKLDVTSLGTSRVEYNGGDQNVVLPEGSSYHTLVLTGTGTKTLPASLTSIEGDLEISGSVTVSMSGPLTIAGNFLIGSNAKLYTGAYNHVLKGNLQNNGTFSVTPGYSVSFMGTQEQVIGGDSKTIFDGLVVNNSNRVSMLTDVDINGALTLINGNLFVGPATLGINGTISAASKIATETLSSLYFGGTTAFTLPDDIFLPEAPVLNHLTIDRSAGVEMNNQSIGINGDLTLTAGAFNISGKTLSLAGDIERTSGTLITNANTQLVFALNDELLSLPDNMFTDPNLGTLIMNRFGGLGLGNQTLNIAQKLILSEGLIYTDYSGIIHLVATASVGTNAENNIPGYENSYISGIVRKTGNTVFTFPIGNNGYYAPIGISAAIGDGNNAEEYFTASYHNTNPNTSFNRDDKDANIEEVSDAEYWLLDRNADGSGQNNVRVTLTWNEARSTTITDPDEMQVARWNGIQWEGNAVYYSTGSQVSGSITSDYIYDFSPFTLATRSSSWALPVDLLFFRVECADQSVLFKWQTASEVNNDFYSIESSTDLYAWSTVAVIPGAGNSNELLSYQFEANLAEQGIIVYYRLRQTDFDGNYTHSGIKALQCMPYEFKTEIILFPNPAKDMIYIAGLPGKTADLSIYDHLGRLHLQSRTTAEGIHSLSISALPAGIYLLRISIESDNIVRRIVKK